MQWNYNFSAGLAALTCEDLQEGMALQEALDRGSLHHHNRHFTCFFKCFFIVFLSTYNAWDAAPTHGLSGQRRGISACYLGRSKELH